MESTLEQPLRFFENFIIFGIESFMQNNISEFVEFSGYDILELDLERYSVKYRGINKDGIVEEHTYTYYNDLYYLLHFQFLKTKGLINKSYVQLSSQEFDRLIESIKKDIESIFLRGKESIIKFPLLLKPIKEIVKFINDKFRENSDTKINLDLSNFEDDEIEDLGLLGSFDDKVLLVLGYLKGYNDRGEKIMSDLQFDIMINYVRHFLSTNELPEIEDRISHINISKNQLKFTFWVLHKHLYETTRPLNLSFVKLVKDIFEDFDNWQLFTFKNKFGNKDRVTFGGVGFLPEIIKIELRS